MLASRIVLRHFRPASLFELPRKAARSTPLRALRTLGLAALFLIGAGLGIWPHSGLGQESRGITTVDKDAPADAGPPAPGAAVIPGAFRALIIGNDKYSGKKWPPLKTATKDAREIAKTLTEQYGFAEKDVLLRLNVTRREMLRAFGQIAESAQPDDSVLVYYAGHGEYDELERGWWVPVDAEERVDYVSSDDVLGYLRSIKARHKLLISDSCFSGNMLTRAARAQVDLAQQPTRFVLEKARLASVQGLSSGGNEPVSDGGAQWEGHSIFAYHLLAQLRANQRRYLSASQLGFVMAERVANDTASAFGQGQTPIFSPVRNQGDQGGDFFFVNQRAVTTRAAVYFVEEGSALTEPLLPGARTVVAARIAQDLRALGIEPVEAPRSLRRDELGDKFAARLQESGVDRALVLSLSADIRRDKTLMWDAVSDLGLRMDAYRMQDGKPVKSSSQPLAAQRLPMKQWSQDESLLSDHFRRNAEKLMERNPLSKLEPFLEQLRE